MALIQWSADLSVGVGEMDRQHQQLVKLINDLYDAMRAGKAKAVIGQVIESLIQYTRSHFTTEEKYFKQFGYPNAQDHIREHVNFIGKVAAFKKDFDSNRLGLSITVMDFLSDWLRSHIKGVDHQYSAFFLEKGLK
jgi:hemerythrin